MYLISNVRLSFYELQILKNNFATNYDIIRLLFYHRLNGMKILVESISIEVMNEGDAQVRSFVL